MVREVQSSMLTHAAVDVEIYYAIHTMSWHSFFLPYWETVATVERGTSS